MKALLVFIFGLVAGVILQYKFGPPRDDELPLAEHGSAFDQKLKAWHLTSEDIRADLGKTGEVVRTKTVEAGYKIEDARIHAVIKAKYVLDKDLSNASKIDINVRGGAVLITGTVKSERLIGRAIELAMDTDGVGAVSARLSVVP